MDISAENVAAFGGRLSTVERSLGRRLDILTDLVSGSIRDPGRTWPQSAISSPALANDLTTSDLEDEPLSGQEGPDSSGSRSNSASIVVNDGPVERFYGESSTYSHLIHSRKLVEEMLNAGKQHNPNPPQVSKGHDHRRLSPRPSSSVTGGPSIFSEVQRRFDSFSGTSKFKEHFDVGDDRPLELPPRRDLEDAIEVYLAEQGLEPPLFQRQKLIDAVSEQYQIGRLEADESWTLCFNNIVLRSSTWKSRTFRVNSFFAASNMDENILSSLLANANKALRQLERFCVPRLVNIQALFLLVSSV